LERATVEHIRTPLVARGLATEAMIREHLEIERQRPVRDGTATAR
jgi:hypothetical protein